MWFIWWTLFELLTMMGSWSGKKGLYGYILCIFLALRVFHEFQIHSFIHSFIHVFIQQTYVLGVNNILCVRDTRQSYREISKSVQSTGGKKKILGSDWYAISLF